MFGMSFTELVIILVLALLLLGPDQLPSVARTLGKGLRELRKASDDLRSTFEQEFVQLDEPDRPRPPPASILPPQPLGVPEDPGAARAAARLAAEDPGAARAAARMAALAPPTPVAAAGAVSRGPAAPEAAPAAPPGPTGEKDPA